MTSAFAWPRFVLLPSILLVALSGVAEAAPIYLNDLNITVALGSSMPANPFENQTTAISLANYSLSRISRLPPFGCLRDATRARPTMPNSTDPDQNCKEFDCSAAWKIRLSSNDELMSVYKSERIRQLG